MDDLIPIRLRMSLAGHALCDSFVWPSQDGQARMQRFAEGLCKDTGIPLSFAPAVVKEIKRQVDEWEGRAQPCKTPPATERLEVIRLDFAVGVTRFTDQLVWDVNNSAASPEEFAMRLGKDLNLDPALTMEVACKLREQLAQLRRQHLPSKHSSPSALGAAASEEHLGSPGTGRPSRKRGRAGSALVEAGAQGPGTPLRSIHQGPWIRPPDAWDEWGPEVRVMSSHEALQFAAQAAQQAHRAEAEATAAAEADQQAQAEVLREAQVAQAARSPTPSAAAPALAAAAAAAAAAPAVAPAAESGEANVRQLRPRRTARLTELMMAQGGDNSPRAQSLSAGGPSSKSLAPPAGGSAPLPAVAAATAAATAAAGTAPTPTAAPAASVRSEGRTRAAAVSLGPSLAASGGAGLTPTGALTARQQQMLQRRQMLLLEASQGGKGPGARGNNSGLVPLEQDFSGNLSSQYSALLRTYHGQESTLLSSQLLSSQALPSPVFPGGSHHSEQGPQQKVATTTLSTRQQVAVAAAQQAHMLQRRSVDLLRRSQELLKASQELRKEPGSAPTGMVGLAELGGSVGGAGGGGSSLLPTQGSAGLLASGGLLGSGGSGSGGIGRTASGGVMGGSGSGGILGGAGSGGVQAVGGGGGMQVPLQQLLPSSGSGGSGAGPGAAAAKKRSPYANLFGEMFEGADITVGRSDPMQLESCGPMKLPPLEGGGGMQLSGNMSGMLGLWGGGQSGGLAQMPSVPLSQATGLQQLQADAGGADVELLPPVGNVPASASMFF